MSIWRVQGGYPLEGSLTIQGAKNAVLPVLAAAILTGCETELTNVPALRDVEASLEILRQLGCVVQRQGGTVAIDSRNVTGCRIPRELTGQMRSSIVFLGAILARCGQARIAMPGGCELGPRPVDLHLAAMEALGAEVRVEQGEIVCRAPGLTGGTVHLALPSVGATENAMIAACAARGETILTGAAKEPEIVELQGFLRVLGADVEGAGTSVIKIRGMRPVRHALWRVMPDRIVGATMLCACACAGGDLELRGLDPAHVGSVAEELAAMGAQLDAGTRRLRIRCGGRLRGGRTIVTEPYPGFPTDAQPLMMAASLKAAGRTTFVENIFDHRYRQAAHFAAMGADIRLDGRRAVVTGVERLRGARVEAEDLRGGAALIIAGLGAEGETEILDRGHVARGYEGFDRVLSALGGHIKIDPARQE